MTLVARGYDDPSTNILISDFHKGMFKITKLYDNYIYLR